MADRANFERSFLHPTYRVMLAKMDGDEEMINKLLSGPFRDVAISGLVFWATRAIMLEYPGMSERAVLTKLVVDTWLEAGGDLKDLL